MTKITDPSYRVATNAYLRDKWGNEYTGDQLLLALLLHTKNTRGRHNIEEVARILDDPNLKEE